MSWRLRSAASDLNPKGIPWRLVWRRVCSWDGLLLLTEAAIYLSSLFLLYALAMDWLETGSSLSAWAFVTIGLYGHWPLIRRRLRRGDWPG